MRGMRFVPAAIALFAVTFLVSTSAAPTTGGRSVQVPPAGKVVATYASGAGISYLGARVDAKGHLALESPRGQNLIGFDEGYGLCTGGDTASAMDFHGSEYVVVRGFAPPTISQPTAGAFPVTITRQTKDGRFRLVQRWALPDVTDKTVTVTMTLTNMGATTASGIELLRETEAPSNYGDLPALTIGASGDGVWWWGTLGSHGVMMSARTLGVPHEGGFTTDIDLPDACGSYYDPGPSSLDAGGYARVAYFLPDLPPNHTVSVAVVFHRI